MSQEKQLRELSFGDAVERIVDMRAVACQVLRISAERYRQLLQTIGQEEISRLIDGVRARTVEPDVADELLKLEAAG